MRTGDFIATPSGVARVGLIMGQRVRADFMGGARKTFDMSDCVVLINYTRSAEVVNIADHRRRKFVRAVPTQPTPGAA